jgi:hypothetical protein
MVRTLRIYGDSFAEEKLGCWANILAKNLRMQCKIKAVGGSCTEYAFKHFIKDLKNQEFGKSDVIIFVMSSPGRLNFSYQLNEKPETGTQIIRDFNDNKVVNPRNNWYNENEGYIDWYLANKDHSLDNINHEAYISVIKDTAYNYPDALFIVLPIVPIFCDLGLKTNPDNFLRSYTYLNEISKGEVIGVSIRENWYKRFISFTNNIDVRINHLTDPNIKILAYTLEEVIRTRSIDLLKYNIFKKEIIPYITSEEDWNDGIKKGYYIYQDHIKNMFSNKNR